MPSESPTLTRRSFLSAAAAGIVSSPIWAKANAARVSDSAFAQGWFDQEDEKEKEIRALGGWLNGA